MISGFNNKELKNIFLGYFANQFMALGFEIMNPQSLNLFLSALSSVQWLLLP